ncbi:MAG: sulfotransferase domain-containing protein [Anaerolineales bacterium]|nr:sulfotransferase domain-containing protein [Anaerolineales bacterium]
MLPDFIILGAQKAGSTFLHYCLEEHPDLYMPHHEVHFFEDPIYDPARLSELTDLRPPHTTAAHWGIKRADYFSRPECPRHIFTHCPDVQLFVVLRNPIQRLVSAYYHFMYYGFIPVRSIETGIDNILAGRYARRYPAGHYLIDFGMYFQHLSRYLELFPAQQLHVILFDDLREKPQMVLSNVFRQLGVAENFSPQAMNSRPQAALYSLPRLLFRSLRHRLVYEYDAERSRSYPRKPLSSTRQAANRLILVADRRLLRPLFPKQKPALSPELKARLEAIYADEMCRLEDFLQRDLKALGWP